jgi:dihydrofolate reductase
MEIVMIAACDPRGVIGNDGGIPWHIPEDLKHFKYITVGHEIIIGRKTFESMNGPLPERENIVLTSKDEIDGADVAHSPDEALMSVEGDKVFICGGEGVYREFMPIADKLILSHVHETYDGDTYFPNVSPEDWEIVDRDEYDEFHIATYVRPGKNR